MSNKVLKASDICDDDGKVKMDLGGLLGQCNFDEEALRKIVCSNKREQLKKLKNIKDVLDEADTMERLQNEREYNEKVSDIIFGTGERPKLVAKMNSDNPKSCYDFVDFNKIETKDPFEYIDESKLDYDIALPEGETKHKKSLPISFMSIKEGEVEKGKEWYMNYDPKLPEGIAELLARYNWGDMKYMTKKSAKNQRKKNVKKGKKEGIELRIKKGEHILHFD